MGRHARTGWGVPAQVCRKSKSPAETGGASVDLGRGGDLGESLIASPTPSTLAQSQIRMQVLSVDQKICTVVAHLDLKDLLAVTVHDSVVIARSKVSSKHGRSEASLTDLNLMQDSVSSWSLVSSDPNGEVASPGSVVLHRSAAIHASVLE